MKNSGEMKMFLAPAILLALASFPAILKSLKIGLILIAWAITIVSITIIVVRRTKGPQNRMDIVLPKLSPGAIMLYIVIVAAHNKATLLSIGPALFIATIVHNLHGYISEYTLSRAFGYSEADARAVTMEVGTRMNISASSPATFRSQRGPGSKKILSEIRN
jgi:bile acid:Na+ symporter, BASS family